MNYKIAVDFLLKMSYNYTDFINFLSKEGA